MSEEGRPIEAWTTYLIGGGGLSAIGLLIWKLISATVSGVQAENVRLGGRLKSLEIDYDALMTRTRKAETELGDLQVKYNDLYRTMHPTGGGMQ